MAAMNTGRIIHNIPLEIQSPDFADLVFLRAEVNASRMTPFALVWYAIAEHERTKALRLDLDKGIFLGLADLETPQFQRVAETLAPMISGRITRELLKWFISNSPTA
jgi:hypothetical protein